MKKIVPFMGIHAALSLLLMAGVLGTDDAGAKQHAGIGTAGTGYGISTGYGIDKKYGDIVSGKAFLYLSPIKGCLKKGDSLYNLDCYDFVLEHPSSKLPTKNDMKSNYKGIATASKAQAMLLSLEYSTNKMVSHKQIFKQNKLREYEYAKLKESNHYAEKASFCY